MPTNQQLCSMSGENNKIFFSRKSRDKTAAKSGQRLDHYNGFYHLMGGFLMK